MRWQKRLRLAIALFVVVFAALVVVSLRKGRQPAAPLGRGPDEARPEGGHPRVARAPTPATRRARRPSRIKFGNQLTYADGRSKFGGGVTVELPDKNGRQITIESQEAEVTAPPGKEVGTAVFTGGVKLTTSDGIVVTTATATYNDDEQMTRIPGPLTFKKGRMTGTGVGATYDQARNVLWLLDQAKVDVAPDKKGNGAIHVTSKTAGMARNEHYMKFTGDARLDGEGHVIVGRRRDGVPDRRRRADDAHGAARQLPDHRQARRERAAGHARERHRPRVRGGRAHAAVGAPGRERVGAAAGREGQDRTADRRQGDRHRARAGRVDGHQLVANENVQVDLPPDGDMPARRIRSASLLATGAAGRGHPGRDVLRRRRVPRDAAPRAAR